MNIILIGYRACGKTSIGKKLASQLALSFVDVDHETCARFKNDSIADIWAKFGEPAWRREEVAVTSELCARPSQVIALGGGTLMQEGARKAVDSAADTLRIYLKATPEELHKRISADKQSSATRPNLTNLGGGVDEVRVMLERRGPTYEAVADHVIDVTAISIDDATAQIVALAQSPRKK